MAAGFRHVPDAVAQPRSPAGSRRNDSPVPMPSVAVTRNSLFAPETIAGRAIRVGRQGYGRQYLPVDLDQPEEERRLITGIHEVCGEMCRRLEEDFGVSLPLEKVCRMMDQIDAKTIDHLRPREGEARRSLLPEPVAILFFDCTTLSFGTAVEDAPRRHGSSKDCKHRDSQVLPALMVTREGLPISCEVFPGATCEGHGPVPVLQGHAALPTGGAHGLCGRPGHAERRRS